MNETAERRRALKAYEDYVGDAEYAAETFDEAYQGRWGSEQEFAEQLADDIWGAALARLDMPVHYFDYEAFAQDVFANDHFSAPAPGGQVFVFRGI